MNKIAALIDFTEVTPKIIDFSAEQAKANGAELYLLHVEQESGAKLYRKIDEAERNRKAKILRHEHKDLLAKASELREHFEIRVHPILMEDSEVEEAIVDEIKKIEADHVVLGNHHHGGLHNYLFGAVGQRIIKQLSCPLTLISAEVSE